jgi:hypothetical protein
MNDIPKTDNLFLILHRAGWSISDTALRARTVTSDRSTLRRAIRIRAEGKSHVEVRKPAGGQDDETSQVHSVYGESIVIPQGRYQTDLKSSWHRIGGDDGGMALGSALDPNLLEELDDGARIGQSVRVVVLARFHDPLDGTAERLESIVDES